MKNRKIKKFTLVLLCIFCWQVTATTALAKKSQDPNKTLALHYYRGVVYYEAGRYLDALQEFQEVEALNPLYKQTREYIANAIHRLDQDRLKQMKRLGKESSSQRIMNLYFMGKTHYERGDYRRALETFETVLEKYPTDKFAQYYAQKSRIALGLPPEGKQKEPPKETPEPKLTDILSELERDVNQKKRISRDQERIDEIMKAKAKRRTSRRELIRKKQMELREQEIFLEEERKDYLEQKKISKRMERLRRKQTKWKNLKDSLASKAPGIPSGLSEFPIYLDKAERYYVAMKEALYQGRWNSAGYNAVYSAVHYCDAILIYFHDVKSAFPQHENIARLLKKHVKHQNIDEGISRLQSILRLKRLVEDEERSFRRHEAIFLSEKIEKIVEWIKSILP